MTIENKVCPEIPSGTQTTGPANSSGTQKVRRSGRISLAVPILIIGNDAEGRVFSEETHTVVLSRHGAGIVSKEKLMAEQELVLRVMATSREAEVRVVGEIAQQGSMHTYGVAFLDEKLDFWQMEFPPAPARDERPEVLALECGGCKEVVELVNGDFEYDICAIHGGLARFCSRCGLLTVWRQTSEVMRTGPRVGAGARTMEAAKAPMAVAEEERGAANEKGPELQTVAEGMARTERRRRTRAKVNFLACVRSAEFGEEVVKCIDMSRGGVGFRSKNCYTKGMQVRIAVPFSPEEKEAPAMFVRARIANAREMEGEGMWRCGVEFLKG